MFGYVKAYAPEMRVRENEYYRAMYCGLCRSMGKCTGFCSRMTLSYDFTFLASVRMAISGTHPTFSQKRCFVHPLRKRSIMDRNGDLDYCAYACGLLTYHKNRDDMTDEKKFRKKWIRSHIASPFMSISHRRARKKYGELDKKIFDLLARLSEIERSEVNSVDIPAEVFGEILAEITAFGFDGNNEKIARHIGMSVGKWIYIVDAIDDYEQDLKKKRFNPFINLWKGEEITPERRKYINVALLNELSYAEQAFDLIDYGDRKDLKEIVLNIIYLGMPEVAKKAVFGDTESSKNKTPETERSQKDD